MQARTRGAAGAGRVDRAGRVDQGRRGGPGRRAGDRASVVAAVARGRPGRAGQPRVSAGASTDAAQLPVVAVGRNRGADPAGPRAHQLRPSTAAGALRAAALDDLEGAPSPRLLAPAPRREAPELSPL